jgi:hypothetical protein
VRELSLNVFQCKVGVDSEPEGTATIVVPRPDEEDSDVFKLSPSVDVIYAWKRLSVSPKVCRLFYFALASITLFL